jgi:hypothetical protein
MSTSVVVTYQVRPELVDEHLRLIEAVFAQLHDEQPADVEYKVLVLDDGVSFVHVSTADTPDGSNPLPRLASFQRFNDGIGTRVAALPRPAAARVVGAYHPRADRTPT